MKSTDQSPVATTRRCHGCRCAAVAVGMTLVLAAALIPDTAATAREKPLELILTAVDTDGDGQINESEWHAAMQKRFTKMDQNADGKISGSELESTTASARQRFRDLKTGWPVLPYITVTTTGDDTTGSRKSLSAP